MIEMIENVTIHLSYNSMNEFLKNYYSVYSDMYREDDGMIYLRIKLKSKSIFLNDKKISLIELANEINRHKPHLNEEKVQQLRNEIIRRGINEL